MKKLIMTLVLSLCLGAPAFADVIYLNEGEEHIGKLNTIKDGTISFKTLDGDNKSFFATETANLLISKIRKGDEISSIASITDPIAIEVLKNIPNPAQFKDSDYITLLVKRNFKYLDDGSALYTRREFIQILKEPGLDMANRSLYYLKDREKTELIFAHTYSPSGKVYHVTDDAVSEENLLSANPEYARLKKLKFALKKAELGSIIDLCYSQHLSNINEIQPFTISKTFGEREPVLKETLTVSYPEKRNIQIAKFQWPDKNAPVQTEKIENGRKIIEWSYSDPEGFIPEQNMLSTSQIFPRVYLYDAYKWENIAGKLIQAYNESAPDKELLDKFIENAKLSADDTDFEKICKIYETVNREIRGVGIGISSMGSYKPVSANITLKKKYANRHAKTALFYYALKSLGIKCEFGFCAGKREKAATMAISDISMFDEPIVKVILGQQAFYTDLGSLYRPFGSLSTSLQGGGTVFVDETNKNIKFETLPVLTNDWNRFDRNIFVQILDDGSMDVKETITYRGPFETGLRQLRSSKDKEKQNYAQRRIKGVHPSAVLKSFGLSNLDSLQAPAVMTLYYNIPDAAQKASDLIMTFTNLWVNYQSSSASLQKRKFPMQYWATEENNQTIIFELPKNFKWVKWDKQYSFESAGLSFLSTMHQDGNLLIYADRFIAREDEFKTGKEYGNYRKCLLTMSELANQIIIIEKAKPEEPEKVEKIATDQDKNASDTIDAKTESHE